ncbi:MAG: hypothetical protein RBT05_09645 [Bacteroidales bacterium]|jgi:hypothetical protein|nr:hypothetical protein [Bacteroidales bacterium]
MIKKKKSRILIILAVFISVGIYCLYYYYPRRIDFEFVKEIEKPNKEYDNSQFIGFDYIKDADRLMFFMVDYYKKASCIRDSLGGYDSLFVQNLSNELNFDKYDYIITYHKQLKELRHSPYLTKKRDGLYFEKQIPLIPNFDTLITDKLYIYRIKKNNKYRAPGP